MVKDKPSVTKSASERRSKRRNDRNRVKKHVVHDSSDYDDEDDEDDFGADHSNLIKNQYFYSSSLAANPYEDSQINYFTWDILQKVLPKLPDLDIFLQKD